MTWKDNPILLGRLAILPLALLEWGVVVWYAKRLDSKNFLKKLLAAIVSVSLIFGITFGQFSIYKWVTHTTRPPDHFVSVVGFVESVISLILFFSMLIKLNKNG